MTSRLKTMDKENEIESDWKFAAMVIDVWIIKKRGNEKKYPGHGIPCDAETSKTLLGQMHEFMNEHQSTHVKYHGQCVADQQASDCQRCPAIPARNEKNEVQSRMTQDDRRDKVDPIDPWFRFREIADQFTGFREGKVCTVRVAR